MTSENNPTKQGTILFPFCDGLRFGMDSSGGGVLAQDAHVVYVRDSRVSISVLSSNGLLVLLAISRGGAARARGATEQRDMDTKYARVGKKEGERATALGDRHGCRRCC